MEEIVFKLVTLRECSRDFPMNESWM